jgi:nucleoside-diphosphate-sugar epimerase
MHVLFLGFGFSSRAAARALRAEFGATITITGTARSADKLAAIEKEGVIPCLFDGTAANPSIAAAIADATHIVQSIAPDETGDPVLAHLAPNIAAAPALQWLCYYSTVGVYGNFDGAWVDEAAPCAPLNKRSQWRVVAEERWRQLAAERALPLTILRLAGIYGPGRSQFEKLKSGTARRINKPGQVFNRIHVEDIARVTTLAATQNLSGTFNLADDEPTPPQQVVTRAADMLGLVPPPEIAFEEADMSPMARSFYADNKRISNAAIKQVLGINLLYPTYREGLAAILKDHKANG